MIFQYDELIKEKIKQFLKENDYREFIDKKDAYWMNQKCTIDCLNFVSKNIFTLISENNTLDFDKLELEKKYEPEYKKFFSKEKITDDYKNIITQNLNLLSKSKIIIKNEKKYAVKEMEILNFISSSDDNCLSFLQLYLVKVLEGLQLYNDFKYYFSNHNKEELEKLIQVYKNFILEKTKIKGKKEIKRIFNKILNILAIKYNFKAGIKKGKMSQIKKNDLLYNKENPIKKPKKKKTLSNE